MKRAFLLVTAVLAVVACGKNDEPTSTASPTAPGASAPTPAKTAPPPPPIAAPTYDASAVNALFSDAGLTAREESELDSALARFDAPCPSLAVSVAQCVAEKRDCSACELAARYVETGVRAGWPSQYLDLAFHARFDASAVQNLPADGSPTKGPDNAAITITEFGSYVCPHCAAEAPKLDALLKRHPKDVRLVFKPAWSPSNEAVIPPSRAALAAGAQGKFWEMHALLFANQPKFAAADIDGYATQIGLDLAKLHADMQGPKVIDQMARDLALMKAVGVDGLPSIWINGRTYYSFEDFDQRVAFELGALAKKK